MNPKELSVVVAVLCVGGAVWAQDGSKVDPAKKIMKEEPVAPAVMRPPQRPMAPPVPDKMNDGLKAYVGSWSCTGTMLDPTSGAQQAYKSSVKSKWNLGNFWLAITYQREKTAMTPAFTAWAIWGWDAAAKKLDYAGYDSWGGRLHLTAPTVGDSIVFEGEGSQAGKAMPIKLSVQKGDKGKGLSFAAESGAVKLFADTCK